MKNFLRRFGLVSLTSAFALAQTPAPKPALSPKAPAHVPPPIEASAITMAKDFKVELLYAVPNDDQGSWVCITVDPKGRLITGDQYGGLYRITPAPVGSSAETKIERLKVSLVRTDLPPAPPVVAPPAGAPDPKKKKVPAPAAIEVGAHGLLYAFDSLYVMVDENHTNAGLWRLRDTNGDDQFNQATFLREMKGTGEHGAHALVLGPDGKSIYFANGNHTDLPAHMEKSRAVAWGEDHLLPRMWDARGHARNKYAPGGYIGRTDPDGKVIEMFASGFRNEFDMAFDQNGELFTYDSDMEWDQGTPWYVPTRINHVVDAGDYGWRSGAGRWPAYYADSLPAALDIGPRLPDRHDVWHRGEISRELPDRALRVRLDVWHALRDPPHAGWRDLPRRARGICDGQTPRAHRSRGQPARRGDLLRGGWAPLPVGPLSGNLHGQREHGAGENCAAHGRSEAAPHARGAARRGHRPRGRRDRMASPRQP